MSCEGCGCTYCHCPDFTDLPPWEVENHSGITAKEVLEHKCKFCDALKNALKLSRAEVKQLKEWQIKNS